MPSATPAQIVEHIGRYGGATVTLHGRHDIMGDQFDERVYVVGGAKDDNGEVVEEIFPNGRPTPLDEWGPEYQEAFVWSVLEELKERTKLHEYVYTAAGFWIDPAGCVVADLVNTTTLYYMAKQWAEERGQDAFHELVTGQNFFTDHYRNSLREARIREIREDLEAGWAQDVAEVCI